ncbi:nucleoside deaminase [Nitrincola tapanii]|nr:nucleoside deaminase [Nitrincola tapanii]
MQTLMPLFNAKTEITESVLRTIAHMPTSSLPVLVDDACMQAWSDATFMRLAVLLAEKSYQEGGCPIGAVIVDNLTRRILGKGHNTLVQEDHPYNHGETSAIRDAGRIDFSQTTLFTSLSPCDVCATLLYRRGFARVVVGDVTNASGNEALLRTQGIQVDVLEDPKGIDLYVRFRSEQPELEMEDWQGVSGRLRYDV